MPDVDVAVDVGMVEDAGVDVGVTGGVAEEEDAEAEETMVVDETVIPKARR